MTLVVMLLIASIPSAFIIQTAHGATGTICLADPTTAKGSSTPCPTSAPVFDGPKNQLLRVGVFIQGSDALNGFDINLLSNTSFLIPTAIDLSGTVLPTPATIIVECIAGLLITGSTCSANPPDNSTTLHLVVAGKLGALTTAPTTGLLFTALYNVTGTTPTGGVPLPYVRGCSGTSAGGGICVTASNGSVTPVSETAQAASFDNSNVGSLSYVAMKASPKVAGPEFPGIVSSATLNATSVNGYGTTFAGPDSVNITVTAPTGVTTSITGTDPCATGGTFCTVSLSITAPTTAGNYTIIVLGTYPTLDPANNPDTLVSTTIIVVDVVDFGFSINPTTVDFNLGSVGDTSLTLSSLNGFSGSVSLTNSTANGALITSFKPGPVTLTPGQVVVSNVTFSGPASKGTFHFTIKMTSGTRVKFTPTLTVAVISADSTTTVVTCIPGTAIVGKGSQPNCTATVNDQGSGTTNMVGSIYFTSNGPGSFAPPTASCAIPSGSTVSGSCTVTYSPTVAGNQNITASYGGDANHASSQGKTLISALDPTVSKLVCNPNPVEKTLQTSCTVAVSDNVAPGPKSPIGSSPSPPSGTVTISNNSTGTFSPSASCALSPTSTSNSTCSVTYTPSIVAVHVLTASYPGDSGHNASIAKPFGLVATLAPAKISLKCTPNSLTADGSSTSCQAQAIDRSPSPTTPTGTITFSNNATGTFTPTSGSCTLAPGIGTANATCSITYTPTVGGNNNVTGTYSGDLNHGVSANSTIVLVAGFILKASPLKVSPVVGVNGNTTITARALNGFTGTVTLTDSAPAGLNCPALSPNTITLGSSQNSTLSCNSSNPTTYSVSVTGTSGLVSNRITVQYAVNEWQLTLSTSAVTVGEGNSTTVNAAVVSSVNGFTGTVHVKINVTTNVLPSLQPKVSPASQDVSLSAGSSTTITLSITVGPNVVPVHYGITINATGAKLTDQHSIDLNVPRPDFGISSPTGAKIILPGSSGSTTINVTAAYGYNGTVAFSYSASPSGLTCSFSKNSVILLPGGKNSTIVTCSGSVNLYTVTVTGTATETYATGVTHTAIPVFSVVDFAVKSTPTGITINTGQTGHAQINVTWTTGYAGLVSFKAIPSTGLTATVPSSLTCPCTWTLNVTSNTAGTYTLVVNATSGTSTHSVTLTVTVISTVSGQIFGLDPTVFYSIIGVVIAGVAVAGVLLLRRKPKASANK